ncbi:MAG: hypothetical protein I4N51_24930 [Acinetobacter sp.]|nr:hypothetical protein [Acinetobacter sp.]
MNFVLQETARSMHYILFLVYPLPKIFGINSGTKNKKFFWHMPVRSVPGQVSPHPKTIGIDSGTKNKKKNFFGICRPCAGQVGAEYG